MGNTHESHTLGIWLNLTAPRTSPCSTGPASRPYHDAPREFDARGAAGYAFQTMSAAKPIPLISVDEYLAGELLSERKHEYSAGRV